MSLEGRTGNVVVATVGIALAAVREQSRPAGQLIALCSFLHADDVPRRVLYAGASEVPPQLRDPIANPAAIRDAVEVLSRFDLLSVNGDGLAFHRDVQSAVRKGLSRNERDSWATAAGRIVLASFPKRPHDSRTWGWSARLLPHAIAAADHLDLLGIEPLLGCMLRDRSARYLIPQGQLAVAKSVLAQAQARVTEAEPNGSLHATLLSHYALAEHAEGFLNDAKRDAEQALAMHQKVHQPLASEEAAVAARNRTARDDDAHKGAATRQRAHPSLAEDYQILASIASSQGDTEEALQRLGLAYAMLVELYGDKDPEVAEVLSQFFGTYLEHGSYRDAFETLLRASAILEARYGADDPEVVVNRQVLSIFMEPENRDKKARDILRLSESRYGPKHPRTAGACGLLGALLRQLGECGEARRMVDRALEINRGNYGPTHFSVASGLVSLMVLDANEGDPDTAAGRLREISQIVLAAPSHDRVSALRLSGLGEALADIARMPAGVALVTRARETSEDHFRDDKELLAFAHELVVKALLAVGDERLKEGNAADAAAQYEVGLRMARLTTENFLDDALFHVRLALVAGIHSDRDSMSVHMRKTIDCFARGGYATPLWELVRQCSKVRVLSGPVPLAEEELTHLIEQAIEGGTMPDFRGKLTAAIPENWFAKESKTVLAPDGQANVIASSEPLDPSIDTEKYATVQGDLLRTEFPGYTEHIFEQVEIFGGRSGYLRHFEWTPPDTGPVTQIQLYYAESGRGYTATATTPSEAFPARELLLRRS